jgi:ATP-binding cassette, subfamily C, bacterial
MVGLKLVMYFMRAYPWRSALMVCCFIFSGLADGIGVLTLLPIIDSISSGGNAPQSGIGLVMKHVLEIVGVEPRLPALLITLVVVVWTKGAFLLLAMRQAGYTIAHVTTDLRLKLIRALMEARWSYYINHPAGSFANSISSEAFRAGSAYSHATAMTAAVIQAAAYTIVAFVVSWKITLLSVTIAGALMFVMRGLVRVSRNAGNRQTVLLQSLINRLTDALQGIKPIKAMAQENNLQPLLESESQELNRAQRSHVLASETLNAVQEPLMTLIVVVGLYTAITIGKQSFSMLLVMVFLFNRLLGKFYYSQRCYQELSANESALWSLLGKVRQAEEEREEVGDNLTPPLLARGITFDAVSFAYGEKVVLRDVRFEVPSGAFVAVVGPSGAGKTTIVDLIVGLFVPQSGAVRVDGFPLTEIDLRAWRRGIGYVPQEMLLFHESIFRNITFGDDQVSRADVEEALRLAEAWEFVAALPAGMDTSVGERGSNLSGGQRQRLSLARALVRKPKLLILDEVTTALDLQTENEICETLKKLAGNITIISISHQRKMIEYADIVYSIANGEVSLVRGGKDDHLNELSYDQQLFLRKDIASS